jgi:hypothetical protein
MINLIFNLIFKTQAVITGAFGIACHELPAAVLLHTQGKDVGSLVKIHDLWRQRYVFFYHEIKLNGFQLLTKTEGIMKWWLDIKS